MCCLNCGNPLARGQKFCTVCGTPAPPPPGVKPAGKGRVIAMVLVVAALLAAVGMGGWFLFQTLTGGVGKSVREAGGRGGPGPAAAGQSAPVPAEGSGSADAGQSAPVPADGRHWIIVTDIDFAPFEYTDAAGALVGIDVDLLDAIAKDQGFSYELQPLGWDAAIAACQSGQADGMIAAVPITQERQTAGWIFSDSYYNATQCVAVAAQVNIRDFYGLYGKTVAVQSGTQAAAYAEGLQDQYGFILRYLDSDTMVYDSVLSGECVACFEDTSAMATAIRARHLEMRILEGSESPGVPYGLAIFDAKNSRLLTLFNQGLFRLRADGTYREILARYLS